MFDAMTKKILTLLSYFKVDRDQWLVTLVIIRENFQSSQLNLTINDNYFSELNDLIVTR